MLTEFSQSNQEFLLVLYIERVKEMKLLLALAPNTCSAT